MDKRTVLKELGKLYEAWTRDKRSVDVTAPDRWLAGVCDGIMFAIKAVEAMPIGHDKPGWRMGNSKGRVTDDE